MHHTRKAAVRAHFFRRAGISASFVLCLFSRGADGRGDKSASGHRSAAFFAMLLTKRLNCVTLLQAAGGSSPAKGDV